MARPRLSAIASVAIALLALASASAGMGLVYPDPSPPQEPAPVSVPLQKQVAAAAAHDSSAGAHYVLPAVVEGEVFDLALDTTSSVTAIAGSSDVNCFKHVSPSFAEDASTAAALADAEEDVEFEQEMYADLEAESEADMDRKHKHKKHRYSPTHGSKKYHRRFNNKHKHHHNETKHKGPRMYQCKKGKLRARNYRHAPLAGISCRGNLSVFAAPAAVETSILAVAAAGEGALSCEGSAGTTQTGVLGMAPGRARPGLAEVLFGSGAEMDADADSEEEEEESNEMIEEEDSAMESVVLAIQQTVEAGAEKRHRKKKHDDDDDDEVTVGIQACGWDVSHDDKDKHKHGHGKKSHGSVDIGAPHPAHYAKSRHPHPPHDKHDKHSQHKDGEDGYGSDGLDYVPLLGGMVPHARACAAPAAVITEYLAEVLAVEVLDVLVGDQSVLYPGLTYDSAGVPNLRSHSSFSSSDGAGASAGGGSSAGMSYAPDWHKFAGGSGFGSPGSSASAGAGGGITATHRHHTKCKGKKGKGKCDEDRYVHIGAPSPLSSLAGSGFPGTDSGASAGAGASAGGGAYGGFVSKWYPTPSQGGAAAGAGAGGGVAVSASSKSNEKKRGGAAMLQRLHDTCDNETPLSGVIDSSSPFISLPTPIHRALITALRRHIGDTFPSEKAPPAFWSGGQCVPVHRFGADAAPWPAVSVVLRGGLRGSRKQRRGKGNKSDGGVNIVLAETEAETEAEMETEAEAEADEEDAGLLDLIEAEAEVEVEVDTDTEAETEAGKKHKHSRKHKHKGKRRPLLLPYTAHDPSPSTESGHGHGHPGSLPIRLVLTPEQYMPEVPQALCPTGAGSLFVFKERKPTGADHAASKGRKSKGDMDTGAQTTPASAAPFWAKFTAGAGGGASAGASSSASSPGSASGAGGFDWHSFVAGASAGGTAGAGASVFAEIDAEDEADLQGTEMVLFTESAIDAFAESELEAERKGSGKKDEEVHTVTPGKPPHSSKRERQSLARSRTRSVRHLSSAETRAVFAYADSKVIGLGQPLLEAYYTLFRLRTRKARRAAARKARKDAREWTEKLRKKHGKKKRDYVHVPALPVSPGWVGFGEIAGCHRPSRSPTAARAAEAAAARGGQGTDFRKKYEASVAAGVPGGIGSGASGGSGTEAFWAGYTGGGASAGASAGPGGATAGAGAGGGFDWQHFAAPYTMTAPYTGAALGGVPTMAESSTDTDIDVDADKKHHKKKKHHGHHGGLTSVSAGGGASAGVMAGGPGAGGGAAPEWQKMVAKYAHSPSAGGALAAGAETGGGAHGQSERKHKKRKHRHDDDDDDDDDDDEEDRMIVPVPQPPPYSSPSSSKSAHAGAGGGAGFDYSAPFSSVAMQLTALEESETATALAAFTAEENESDASSGSLLLADLAQLRARLSAAAAAIDAEAAADAETEVAEARALTTTTTGPLSAGTEQDAGEAGELAAAHTDWLGAPAPAHVVQLEKRRKKASRARARRQRKARRVQRKLKRAIKAVKRAQRRVRRRLKRAGDKARGGVSDAIKKIKRKEKRNGGSTPGSEIAKAYLRSVRDALAPGAEAVGDTAAGGMQAGVDAMKTVKDHAAATANAAEEGTTAAEFSSDEADGSIDDDAEEVSDAMVQGHAALAAAAAHAAATAIAAADSAAAEDAAARPSYLSTALAHGLGVHMLTGAARKHRAATDAASFPSPASAVAQAARLGSIDHALHRLAWRANELTAAAKTAVAAAYGAALEAPHRGEAGADTEARARARAGAATAAAALDSVAGEAKAEAAAVRAGLGEWRARVGADVAARAHASEHQRRIYHDRVPPHQHAVAAEGEAFDENAYVATETEEDDYKRARSRSSDAVGPDGSPDSDRKRRGDSAPDSSSSAAEDAAHADAAARAALAAPLSPATQHAAAILAAAAAAAADKFRGLEGYALVVIAAANEHARAVASGARSTLKMPGREALEGWRLGKKTTTSDEESGIVRVGERLLTSNPSAPAFGSGSSASDARGSVVEVRAIEAVRSIGKEITDTANRVRREQRALRRAAEAAAAQAVRGQDGEADEIVALEHAEGHEKAAAEHDEDDDEDEDDDHHSDGSDENAEVTWGAYHAHVLVHTQETAANALAHAARVLQADGVLTAAEADAALEASEEALLWKKRGRAGKGEGPSQKVNGKRKGVSDASTLKIALWVVLAAVAVLALAWGVLRAVDAARRKRMQAYTPIPIEGDPINDVEI